MTQSNSPSTPTEGLGPHNPAADTDPLLHLHKMSTTAGVGTEDYVAVNVTSVVAVLFGLASLLSMFNTVLLVFPIVGVILGLIALARCPTATGRKPAKGWQSWGWPCRGSSRP